MLLGCWDQWASLGNPLGLGQASAHPWASAAGSLPRMEASDRPVWRPGGLGSLFTGLWPSLPASPVLRASAVERRAHNRGKLRKVGIEYPHQSCSTHPPPRTSRRFGGISTSSKALGDAALPPPKSSRGEDVSCWQDMAAQRPEAQRGSNILLSRTLRIQPLFFFLSKTCRLVLL